MANTGANDVKFVPTYGTDTQVKNGVFQSISVRYQCITAIKKYECRSLEELRLEFYVAIRGRSDQVIGGLFGSNNATSFQPFGSAIQPMTENVTSFRSTTQFKSPFRNTSLFGFTVDNSESRNTGLFDSNPNNTAPSNTGLFGSNLNNTAPSNTCLFGSNLNYTAPNTGLFCSNLKNTTFPSNMGLFNSTLNNPTSGLKDLSPVNTNVFGSNISNTDPSNRVFTGSTVNNFPCKNTGLFGSSVNNPTSGNTFLFGVTTPPSGNTGLFGSFEKHPFSGNTGPFGSTDKPPSSSNTFRFGVKTPSSGNTGLFGSTDKPPSSGNTGPFGSIEKSPSSGNTGLFGSFEKHSSSGNTGSFGSTDNPPSSSNTFRFGVKTPSSGNTGLFGSTDKPPSSGNTGPFGSVEKSPSSSNIGPFGSTDKPTSSDSTGLFGSTDKPSSSGNTGLFFTFGSSDSNPSFDNTSASTAKQLQILSPRNKKIRKPLRRFPTPSYTTKTSLGAKESTALVTDKYKLDFSNLKMPGPHGACSLETYEPEIRDEEMKKLLSSLQEIFECPVCFRNLGSSLKLCENGHGICGSCFKSVTKCPTCQQLYLPNKPTLLMQIIDRLPKPCSFDDNGCNKIFFDKKEEHEIYCKFRPTSCKFESCDWKGTVADVIDHVKSCKKRTETVLCEIHFPNVDIKQMYTFDKTQDVGFYSAVIFENQLFWKHFHRDSSSKIITHTLHHVPTSKPTVKYYLVVSFNEGEIGFKTYIRSSHQPNDKKDEEISFFVPDKELERFYDSEANGYFYTQKVIVENISDEKNDCNQ